MPLVLALATAIAVAAAADHCIVSGGTGATDGDDPALLQARMRRHAVSERGQSTAEGIPLNYVLYTKPPFEKDHFQGVAVELGLPRSGMGPQQMQLDLGSSTLAFCDAAMAAGVAAQKTELTQCHLYGFPYSQKIVPSSEGPCYEEWFYGSVYKGDVQFFAGPNNTQEAATMQDVHYTIMEKSSAGMSCGLGFDGIFGIAFSGTSFGTYFNNGKDPSKLFTPCRAATPKPSGMCSTHDFARVDVVSPLLESMQSASADKFGFYVDYARTKGLPAGTSKGLGMLYLGQAAVANDLYQDSVSKSTVVTYSKGTNDVDEGPGKWWTFKLAGWSISATPGGPNVSWTRVPSDFCGTGVSGGFNCKFDSGSPFLDIPHEAIVDANKVWYEGHHGATINFEVYRDPLKEGEETVALSLPLSFLIQEQNRGYVRSLGTLTLGLPIFALYYLVFDPKAASITWAALPQ